ncbi:FKBP-type peptidyl prolyl cis-trans isomerase /Apo-metallochaperone SlyD [Stigmatella aurantiaca]|uniref:Peptidyl-prolyl cis-trans isomerase n=1 Tax=Stigmatella aurantiaca TaxID=41 RepID=A0A1H7HHA4_STIAU|nr:MULTISPECIES: peptidylprolyl isomerase [Stigmatella]SEK49679.1 FKBP-type peptidyl prolyl cis-trans isomerase /Apo-metallochaperone SlyD [Stigmatella aurantiaca]
MKVGKDRIVALEYKLHLGDGEVIDESEPGQPLSYLHGGGQIVPGLEGALEGMGVGDAKKVVVSPAEGYGEHESAGLQEVPRSMFPPDAELRPGVRLAAQTDGGEVIPIGIREVKGETVLVDLNHPLAGKTLHFDVTVRDVRAATEEELSHGHAHGPDGHEH